MKSFSIVQGQAGKDGLCGFHAITDASNCPPASYVRSAGLPKLVCFPNIVDIVATFIHACTVRLHMIGGFMVGVPALTRWLKYPKFHRYGEVDEVVSLLDAGVPVNYQDGGGNTGGCN